MPEEFFSWLKVSVLDTHIHLIPNVLSIGNYIYTRLCIFWIN